MDLLEATEARHILSAVEVDAIDTRPDQGVKHKKPVFVDDRNFYRDILAHAGKRVVRDSIA